MSRRSLLGVALLAATSLSAWLVWRQHEAKPADAASDSRWDYVLHDFELVSLDRQSGKESVTVRAPQLRRSRADQTSEIDTPLFLLPDNQGHYWTMRANTGWLDAKGELLRLRDDVRGDSPVTGDVVPTTFRTTSLDVLPKQSQAQTREAVTMTRPGIMQRGVGFEVDLNTRQYKLLSEVKTRYEPNIAR
jgi:lipopolysaccharide export system protein LptC